MHTTCWRPNNSCATPILPFCRMHFSRSPLWTCNCFTRWFASHRAHILFCSLQQNHIMNEQQVGQNWFLSTPPFPSFPLLLSSISSSLLFVTALLLLSISFLVIPTFDCCVIKSSKHAETVKSALISEKQYASTSASRLNVGKRSQYCMICATIPAAWH